MCIYRDPFQSSRILPVGKECFGDRMDFPPLTEEHFGGSWEGGEDGVGDLLLGLLIPEVCWF